MNKSFLVKGPFIVILVLAIGGLAAYFIGRPNVSNQEASVYAIPATTGASSIYTIHCIARNHSSNSFSYESNDGSSYTLLGFFDTYDCSAAMHINPSIRAAAIIKIEKAQHKATANATTPAKTQ